MTAKKKPVAKKTAVKKTAKKKPAVKKRRNEAMTLPTNLPTLDDYIATHKTELTETVLRRIQYAMKNKMVMVQLFKFTDSNFIVTLRDEDFHENVSSIIDYYLESEKYELCENAFKIKKQVEKRYG
jgi:hypothetical protein